MGNENQLKNLLETTFQEDATVAPGATGYSDSVDISGMSTIFVQTVIDAPTNSNFLSGTARATFTVPSLAASSASEYLYFYDAAGNSWCACLDKTGADPDPTGNPWGTTAAGRKVKVDISGQTTAAQVATAVAAGLNGLSALTFAVSAAAGDGTFIVTGLVGGVVTAPGTKNPTSAGSAVHISVVATYAGATSAINLTSNAITVSAHGLTTGSQLRITTTGTRPTPLAGGTDYYAIIVDDDTIKLATSLVNAEAGTAIDLTALGYGTQTLDLTDLNVAVNMEISIDGEVWDEVGSDVSVTAAGSVSFREKNPEYRYIRLSFAVTAGQININSKILGKGL